MSVQIIETYAGSSFFSIKIDRQGAERKCHFKEYVKKMKTSLKNPIEKKNEPRRHEKRKTRN